MVPSLGTLDLGTWEKVHSKLEKLRPVSVWSIWTLIKSILEPLQTPESSEGSEDECELPSEGRPEYAQPAGIEQKTQEALKSTVPSVLLQRMNLLYLHFLPLLS